MAINGDMSSPERARNAVKRFLDENGYKVPVLMDNGSVAQAYGVRSVPMTVIVDPEGRIASMSNGVMSSDQLEREIESAMN